MRIGIDVTPLQRRAEGAGELGRAAGGGRAATGGVPRYVQELLRHWWMVFPEDELLAFSDQEVELPAEVAERVHVLGPRSRSEQRWWLYGLPKRLAEEGVEVFHGTEFSVPYRRSCAAVMTVHDLSPWKEPAWHGVAGREGAGRVRRRMPWLLRLGLADRLVTPTEAVRREVMERFGVGPERVTAVAHGVRRGAAAAVQSARVANGRRYFLYLGTVEPRKNLPVALAAWQRVRQGDAIGRGEGVREAWPDVEFWVAGRVRQDMPALPEAEGLRMLGTVADEELPGLLRGAAAVVYPTWYEGFGLPVLEAMEQGAVVITSNDAAVREVTGGVGAWHCEAGEVGEWAEALERALADAEWAAGMRQRAAERAAGFSWERCVRETRAVYAAAVAARQRRS